MAVRGLTNQDDARQFVVFERKFLVNTKRWVFITDRFRAIHLVANFTSGENIDSHDFQLGGGSGAGEDGARDD